MLRQLRITVEGRSYDVTVEDLTDTVGGQLYPSPGSMTTTPPAESPVVSHAPASTPDSGAGADTTGGGEGAVISPMSGVVVSLMVDVGSKVEAGDTVAVIEAMKMKTPLVSSVAGTVVSMSVGVGDPVEAGHPVLTLG